MITLPENLGSIFLDGGTARPQESEVRVRRELSERIIFLAFSRVTFE